MTQKKDDEIRNLDDWFNKPVDDDPFGLKSVQIEPEDDDPFGLKKVVVTENIPWFLQNAPEYPVPEAPQQPKSVVVQPKSITGFFTKIFKSL